MFEFFAGIGFQRFALEKYSIDNQDNPHIDFQSIGNCEWGVYENITYGIMHENLKANNEHSEQFLDAELLKMNLSFNLKQPAKLLKNKPYEFKMYLYEALKANKTLPNINDIHPKQLDELKADLWTYSFPCTDISILNAKTNTSAGLQKENGASAIVWQFLKLLQAVKHKPRYLLMENVKALLNKHNRGDFEKIKQIINAEGYISYEILMDGLQQGAVQRRPRVFMLSIRNDLSLPFENTHNDFIEYVKQYYPDPKAAFKNRKRRLLDCVSEFCEHIDEIKKFMLSKHIKISHKMVKHCKTFLNFDENPFYIIPALNAKKDTPPQVINAPLIKVNQGQQEEMNMEGFLPYRFQTVRERFNSFGLYDYHYEKLKAHPASKYLSERILCRQVGNGILVEQLSILYKVISDIEIINPRQVTEQQWNTFDTTQIAYIVCEKYKYIKSQMQEWINEVVKKNDKSLFEKYNQLEEVFETYTQEHHPNIIKLQKFNELINEIEKYRE
ncbi:DNA cytosine methyltransferase [Mycoplasmopsis mustelae]|nr:DNA cytosine methyltransferase [Mycoplasmopsis mustelae]